MIQFIIVILSIIIQVFIIKKTFSNKCRNYKTMIYFVIFWWNVLILLSILSYMNTFPLTLKTTIFLCLGNVSFTIGYCFFKKKELPLKKFKKSLLSFNVSFSIEKVFKFIQIFLLVILCYYFIRYEMLLEIHGIEMARMIKFRLGLLFFTSFESFMFQYVLTGLLQICIFYCFIKFFFFSINKIDLVIAIANIILFSLIGQGRMIYFQLLIIMFVFIVKKWNDNPTFFKEKMKFFILCFLLIIVLLIIMTFIRMGLSLNNFNRIPEYFDRTFTQVYVYFTGPFKGLDYYINNNLASGNFIPGQFTFYVLFHPLIKILELFIPSLSLDNPMVFLQQNVPISNYTEFNAMFTYYINFYKDFSYLGFIILPICLGYFSALLVKLMDHKNIIIKIFAFLNFTNIILGTLRWEYQNYDVIFSVFFLIIFYMMNIGGKKDDKNSL